MSPLRLTGSTSGYSQIDAPAVAGDQTFTLPGTGGTLVTTNAGSVTTAMLADSVPVAKAWVNFNGTGTVAIRASYNVSSITDNGVGDYTVNFTTAMADANYSVVLGSNAVVNTCYSFINTLATGSTRFGTVQNNASADVTIITVAIFR